MTKNETKAFDFQFDVKEEGGVMRLRGYGAIFGNTDQGGDMMLPGCFKESLSRRLPKMGWQHDCRSLPGVWEVAREDTRGLYLEGRFIDTTLGRDAYVQAKEGAIDSLSIGYRTIEADFDNNIRLLKKVELYEVSLVTFPMNESARIVDVKHANEIETIREFESFLRDVGGFSAQRAKSIAAVGFKEAKSSHRDDGLEALSEALKEFNQKLGVTP